MAVKFKLGNDEEESEDFELGVSGYKLRIVDETIEIINLSPEISRLCSVDLSKCKSFSFVTKRIPKLKTIAAIFSLLAIGFLYYSFMYRLNDNFWLKILLFLSAFSGIAALLSFHKYKTSKELILELDGDEVVSFSGSMFCEKEVEVIFREFQKVMIESTSSRI